MQDALCFLHVANSDCVDAGRNRRVVVATREYCVAEEHHVLQGDAANLCQLAQSKSLVDPSRVMSTDVVPPMLIDQPGKDCSSMACNCSRLRRSGSQARLASSGAFCPMPE